MTRRVGPRLVPLLLVPLLAAACGTAPEARRPPGTTQQPVAAAAEVDGAYNDTDVMFLQMMVAHHEQGLEMVRLAADRARRDPVRTLAAAVAVTQADEVTLMTSWLRDWAKPTTVDHDPTTHADHGGLPATGEEQIAALRKTKGAAFETAFLNLFIAHQHNAVEMAAMEREKGSNATARQFAERVEQSRADQIRQMLALLNE